MKEFNHSPTLDYAMNEYYAYQDNHSDSDSDSVSSLSDIINGKHVEVSAG